jgi:two-component system, response regulator PdtaR
MHKADRFLLQPSGTTLGKHAFDTMETVTHPCVVIVVEDESLIRLAAAFAFEDAHFAVIEAGTADEAVEVLEREAEHIHAVFTDVNMPGTMNGVELAHHVRKHWPHIGLVAASGRHRLQTAELPAGSRFLGKPYNLDDVVGHVRDLVPDECNDHHGKRCG